MAEKHPFTTDGYVHAHMLGSVDCVVCGERIGAPAHLEPWTGLPPLDSAESDTSSNARPDTADDGTVWPETTPDA